MNRKGKFFIIFLLFFFACSKTTDLTKASYDKGIRDFSFVRPPEKIAIGVIHYKDSRKNWENYGKELGLLKVTITQMALKLTEEILKKKWEFASISVIPILNFPPSTLEEYEYLKKTYQVDYILVGEVKEAKVVRINVPTSMSYKLKIFLNRGFLPEAFYYESRVLVTGSLYSFEKGNFIWQGSGYSKIKENKRLTKDTILIVALHNAIGRMLEEMSKNFSIPVKEVS